MTKKIFVASMFIFAVYMLCAGSAFAQVAESERKAGEGPWPVYAITYGKGIILTSPDGEAWTLRHSGVDVPLYDLEYGKESFAAVGVRGTIVQGTRDGSTWTIRQSGVQSDLWAVKFAKGIFVAVGSAGTVTTSPDGTVWTKRANLTPYSLRNLAYGKNNFVTIGERGFIFNSKDGINWTRRPSQYTGHLLGLTYAQNTFVAVGADGKIMTSTDDGVTWTERYSGTSETLSAVAYGNNKFVAVGSFGAIVTSPDGRNWTRMDSGSQNWLAAITYSRQQFIAISPDGTTLTSPDGANWSFARYGYGQIAKAKPETIVVIKYVPKIVERVVFVAAEPQVEKKVAVAVKEPKVIILAFEDVHFDYNKSTLSTDAKTILKRNIQLLKDNPNAKVRIAGYTSAAGTEAYNYELSERRAMAVEEYLVNEGFVSWDRLVTVGYGATNPAAYEAAPKEIYSKAAKANMRVLFEIIVQ
jgi:outer membrane protein OmpA-like peptidoglycan-associated protein